MSSRFTTAALWGLLLGPMGGFALLALAGRPTSTLPPVTAPVSVWFVVCPTGGFWGPYSTVDACRTKLEVVKDTCLSPLSAAHTPNPAFVAIAEICRDALNGTQCACEYDVAVPGRPILPGYYSQRL